MECRGCGKEVDNADVRMVAEWPFCPDCFQGLMEKKEKPPEPAETPAPEPVTDETPPEAALPATAPCHLCRRETDAGLLKKVGTWMFCPECYSDLGMPRVVVTPVGREAEPEAADEKTKDAGDEEPGVAGRVRAGFAHYVNCARCGRRIPEGGSRSVDGEPFCPDCYYTVARQSTSPLEDGDPEAKQLPSLETPAESSAARGTMELRCQSCDQPCEQAALVEVEGFRVCRACLGTDRDLALQIARSRRLKLLQCLKENLSKG